MRGPGRMLILLCAVAGAALVVAYLALGGGRYEPLATADPCQPREWRDPEGQAKVAEQIALSSLDGAACELGVSREELTLALASEGDLDRFQQARGLSDERFHEVLRAGLHRAVRDGREAGAINGIEGFLLDRAVDSVPMDRVIEAYRSGDLDWLAGLVGG